MSAASLVAQGYGGYNGWGDAAADADFAATKGQGKFTGSQQPNTAQPMSQPPSYSGGGTPTSAQDLVSMGYGGYAGWGNSEALADFSKTQGSGKYTGSAATNGITSMPTIDLPGLYQKYTQEAGISDLQSTITTKKQAYDKAMATINDNPYLSEANRVGRAQKLTLDYENNIKTDQDALAMAQADVQNKIAIQTKQFDINSQQAQMAMQQFNSLLASGALDNATGQDIANITRATGISSSMIQSAISAQKAKNAPKPQLMQFTDSNGQGFATIDPNTGKVLDKQYVSGPDPTKFDKYYNAGGTSGGSGSSSLTATQQRSVTAAAAKALQDVDTNGVNDNGNQDKLLSKDEFALAIEKVIAATGLDPSTVYDYVWQEFNALGYKKWRW